MSYIWKITKLLLVAIFLVLVIGMVDPRDFNFKQFFLSSDYKQTQDAGILRNVQEISTNRQFEGTIDDIISLVNQTRTEHGEKPLIKNEKLMNSALDKAEDMKEKGYFEHVSPEGLAPWFFVEKEGYTYKTVGENLAEGFFSAADVHSAWMNSEGHRKNILSADFEEIGIGLLAFDDQGMTNYLVVEHFASQLADSGFIIKNKCSKQSRSYCKDAENKLSDIEKTIKDQENIIKNAKKNNIEKPNLFGAEENLESLGKIRMEIKNYLEKCNEYFSKCGG